MRIGVIPRFCAAGRAAREAKSAWDDHFAGHSSAQRAAGPANQASLGPANQTGRRPQRPRPVAPSAPSRQPSAASARYPGTAPGLRDAEQPDGRPADRASLATPPRESLIQMIDSKGCGAVPVDVGPGVPEGRWRPGCGRPDAAPAPRDRGNTPPLATRSVTASRPHGMTTLPTGSAPSPGTSHPGARPASDRRLEPISMRK